MNDISLLPCPFCAGTNILLSHPHEGKPERWVAICTPEEGIEGCGASSTWCPSKDEAANRWNQRLFNEHQIRALVCNDAFLTTHIGMLKVGIEHKHEPVEIVMRNILASCLLSALGIDISR
jgi:hypothetical protein